MTQTTDKNNQTFLGLIRIKKMKQEFSKEDVSFFIRSVVDGTAPDYQISALLMAIYLNDLSKKEIYFLTKSMMESGHVFPSFGPSTVDKHSTGGIGDKSSLVLAPLVASLGVQVPMIAGRGLAHTGGTVDKLESIPGLSSQLTIEAFTKQLKSAGIVLMGQTAAIAPADRKLYALRDVTETVDHIGLITASIMSKKLAEGTAGLVLDIKYGAAAFMKTKARALALAKSLKGMGQKFGRKVSCFITDMNGPTGQWIGNAHEVIESIDILKNAGPNDLRELCIELAAEMVLLGKKANSYQRAKKMVEGALADGSALKKFSEFISLQGGPKDFVANYQDYLKLAEMETVICAKEKGYLSFENAEKLGMMLTRLGGGRTKKEDTIDHSVGIKILKRHGDALAKNEPLAIICHHQNQRELVSSIQNELVSTVLRITKKKPTKHSLIWKKI
jgi:pyrimidine-nucleoside phosphorylase